MTPRARAQERSGIKILPLGKCLEELPFGMNASRRLKLRCQALMVVLLALMTQGSYGNGVVVIDLE
jgi:hypothetical protein